MSSLFSGDKKKEKRGQTGKGTNRGGGDKQDGGDKWRGGTNVGVGNSVSKASRCVNKARKTPTGARIWTRRALKF